jgi:hypothetical protein
MQAPGIDTPLLDRFVTGVLAAVVASSALTREHASTFEISVGVGDGLGLGEGLAVEVEVDEVLEDPHALATRPAIATRPITPPAKTVLATDDQFGTLVRVTFGPVSQAEETLSIDQMSLVAAP